MKNYTITVNGKAYQVSVEEGHVTSAPAPAQNPVVEQPAASPAPTPEVTSAPVASTSQGSVVMNASVPGKIVSILVNVGDKVSKGDSLVVQEAMKMEIPIVAAEDGVVASINVTVGAQVNTGDVIATLE